MNTIRSRVALAVTGAAVLVCVAAGNGFAFFPPRQGRVVPNVEFGALVNGRSSNPVIRMGCFGPVRRGQKGHPMAGQTVEVFRPEVLRVPGFTGSAATQIVARFVDDPSVPIFLPRFGQPQPVPTSLSLPCGGSGKVVFSPEPSSGTAKSVTLSVGFAGQP